LWVLVEKVAATEMPLFPSREVKTEDAVVGGHHVTLLDLRDTQET